MKDQKMGLARATVLLLLLFLLATVMSTSGEPEAQLEEKEMTAGFPGGKMPTAEELLSVLDSMSGMSAEEKETLREELMKNLKGDSEKPVVTGDDDVAHITGSIFFSQFLVLFAMISFIALIFVFFGYKLYISLTERERKREEKKKSKQMKKKK